MYMWRGLQAWRSCNTGRVLRSLINLYLATRQWRLRWWEQALRQRLKALRMACPSARRQQMAS